MEIHVVRTDLLSELQLMQGVIEKKNTMPILANVYIKAENNELILQATDLEVGIITSCPAQVIEPGEFTVNAKQMLDMLNTFSDPQVDMSMNEGTMLDLVCGPARFSIETMSPQDFPSIPECDFADSLKMPIGFFNDCISKVLFSVSADPNKYALNGALLKFQSGDMHLVSTDGHRLSMISKEWGGETADLDIIIPRKTLLEMKKSLNAGKAEEEFQLAVSESRVFFKIGRRTLFSRLIDGKFPDYQKAIPTGNDKSFVFDRAEILEVVRRKSVLSSDKSKLVRLSFQPGELVVVLRNAERGESVDKLAVEFDGPALDVGFNVDYLQDFLKNAGCPKIEINVRDESSQGLFKLVQDEPSFEYRHVIMPMRLTG